jgi:tetratricopeptide (TPR) repeat protein
MPAPRPDRSLLDNLAPSEAGARASQPDSAVDRQARALIARIRKNWNDVEAIRGLADHYSKAGDYPSLANLMEGWGDALEEPKRAADAYVEAADALLLAGRPGDEARLLFERALSRDASHVQALDRVSRVLEDAKNYDRLKQVLKYVAHQLQQQPASQQLLASVHYRLGQVYENHFDEPRKAATLYRQAIEENPRLVTAIVAARRLYDAQGNHKTVSVLYEFEVEATSNVDDKHALLLTLARHKREHCDDLDGAVLAFRRAAKLVPNSVRALFGLAETLLARSERSEPLASAADQQRAAEVFFHLAQRVAPSDATPYLQRALLVAPGHEKARAMLENLRKPATAESVLATPRNADRATGEAGAAEAWLRDGDLKVEVDELSSAELLPIDDEAAARLSEPTEATERTKTRAPSLPPATLESASRPKRQSPMHGLPPAGRGAVAVVAPAPPTPPPVPAAPPAPPPVPAARPAPPPPAAALHPKLTAANLPDDPARAALSVNIGGTTDSNFYVDASDQLIDGGVFVATYSPLSVDARVTLTITLPGKQVARAFGRVLLTRDLMDAFDDHIPGMCIAFERLDARSFALIERFARKRPPMFVD